jgi:succinate-semialdehyde dehydrogenase/glutarate-semialdehyde dehydrogenase
MTSTQHAPTPDEAGALRLAPKDLLVGGEWRPAIGGRRFDVIDPSTEETLASVADATVADAHAALDRAVDTQAAWASTPPRERAEVLRRAFESMMAHSEGLATLMTLEMGKPLAESRSEVAYAAEFFRWFSEESCRVAGRWQESPDGRSRLLVLRQPVGPCLLVTPWNFPLAMGTRKLGPALAAGCTAIVKPAEQTPLSRKKRKKKKLKR